MRITQQIFLLVETFMFERILKHHILHKYLGKAKEGKFKNNSGSVRSKHLSKKDL